jgi:hypothetical protein
MSGKRVIIGQSEWQIADNADKVAGQIKDAMENGTVAELSLEDAGRPVTVYVNGRTVPVVVVDIDTIPRPSEISG